MNPAPSTALHSLAGAELSIIIVNWNSVDYLRNCLASIYEHTQGLDYEIVVVDNASPELGVDRLKDEFPEIILIKSPENLGFARANNLGVKHSSGRRLLFLNPDTELVEPAIQTVLRHMESLPNAGIVGCKLLNSDRSTQTSCIQKFPTILNQLADFQYLQDRWPQCGLWDLGPLFANGCEPRPVEMISGACMLMSRQVFEQIGSFSEEYFMYAEDLDLCYRANRAGLVNYFIGEATVIHHGGKSSAKQSVSEWATRMKFQAILQFCRKTRGRTYGSMFRVAIGLAAMLRLVAIMAAIPFVGAAKFRSAVTKWQAILKWALGADGPPLTPAANH
jgi:GT2 family glycosyltransferase